MATGYRGIHKQQKCEYLQLQLNTRSSCIHSSSVFVFQTLSERWTRSRNRVSAAGFFFFYSCCSAHGRVFSHLRCRWRRMCRDVKISTVFPMSILRTATWPWGELIPDQCAKQHELYSSPIGPASASTLTEKHWTSRSFPSSKISMPLRYNAARWKP